MSDTVNPNLAHHALAEFEQRWPGEFLLITQNINDFHRRAGSRQLIHMHGEPLKLRCTRSGRVCRWLKGSTPPPMRLLPASGPVAPQSWNTICRGIMKAAKVKVRGVNQCRHTYASQLLTFYVELKYIARMTGHTSTAMIRKHYGKWIRKDTPNQAARISTMLGFKEPESIESWKSEFEKDTTHADKKSASAEVIKLKAGAKK